MGVWVRGCLGAAPLGRLCVASSKRKLLNTLPPPPLTHIGLSRFPALSLRCPQVPVCPAVTLVAVWTVTSTTPARHPVRTTTPGSWSPGRSSPSRPLVRARPCVCGRCQCFLAMTCAVALASYLLCKTVFLGPRCGQREGYVHMLVWATCTIYHG